MLACSLGNDVIRAVANALCIVLCYYNNITGVCNWGTKVLQVLQCCSVAGLPH